jgi:hypothetical protein
MFALGRLRTYATAISCDGNLAAEPSIAILLVRVGLTRDLPRRRFSSAATQTCRTILSPPQLTRHQLASERRRNVCNGHRIPSFLSGVAEKGVCMGRLNLRAEAATCPRVASGGLDPAVEAEFLQITKEC